MKVHYFLLTFLAFSTLFLTFDLGMAGPNDIWVSCAVSGGDYSPGGSKTAGGTTYYCCCTDGSAAWTTTACSYPRDVNACSLGGERYFADQQTASCSYQDRGDNICRSSAFASDCTADAACDGRPAGSTFCDGSVVAQCSNSCTYSTVEDCATKATTDTDAGDDPTTQGTVTDYTGCQNGACATSTYTDTCVDAETLTEYYPSGSSYASKTYTCDNLGQGNYCDTNTGDIYFDDWGCSTGACVDLTDTLAQDCVDSCTDSDNGLNYQVQGTVTDNDLCAAGDTSCPSNTYTDYCLDSDTLVEYSCGGNDYSVTQISCSAQFGSEFGCVSGACKDVTQPSVSISHTPSAPTSQDSVTFQATASDSGSGLQKIEIYIDQGTGFSLAKTCTSSPCSYTAGPWQAGTTIRYYAKAYDNAGNIARDPASGSYSFTVQETCVRANPTISINPSLQEGTPGQTLSYTVSVTNNDNSVCGSSTFSLTITSCPSGFTCNLQDSSLTISPGSSAQTTLSVTSPTTASYQDYTFTVKATNTNDNTYSSSATGTYRVTEYNAPTVSVTGAPATWQNTDATASVSCSDAESGCDTTSYRLYISSTQIASCPTDYAQYTYTSPQTISSHVWVCGAAKDNVGNVGFSNVVEFKVDKTPPVGSIVINNDAAYTTSVDVILTLSYYDADSGVNACRYSNDASAWTPWETCVSSRSWTLPAGDGVKTVYYEIKDNAGNIARFNDSIILDTTKPSLSIGHSPTVITSSDQVTFQATASDSGSGLQKIEIYIDQGTGFSLAKTCTSSPCSYTAGPWQAGTTIRYYAKAYDNAGNIARDPASGSYSFTVCQFSLTLNPSSGSYSDTSYEWSIGATDSSSGACPSSITYTIPINAIDVQESVPGACAYANVTPLQFTLVSGSSQGNLLTVNVTRNPSVQGSCSLSFSVFAPDNSQVATATFSVSDQQPPVILEGVSYDGSPTYGNTITLWCRASDAEDTAYQLTVKLWLGTCESANNCYATRQWDIAGVNMNYNPQRDRFEYYWQINYEPGTYVAATCQAYDTQGASSNWGDAYPLLQVQGLCNNNNVCDYGETAQSCPSDCFTRVSVYPKTVSPGQEVELTIEFSAANFTYGYGMREMARNVSFNITIAGMKWSTELCKIAYNIIETEQVWEDYQQQRHGGMHEQYDIEYMEIDRARNYLKITAKCKVPTTLGTGRYQVEVIPILHSEPTPWVPGYDEILVSRLSGLELVTPLSFLELFHKVLTILV